MAGSTHVYTAFLIGSPDVELSVMGGSIALDAMRGPHVEGQLKIALPDLTTLAALEPRLSARIRVEVEATFATMTQTRTFDLALRDRGTPQRDGTVSLILASDEALILERGSLADDITPRSFETSLRDIVDYVLDEAIPGAALEASPATDHNSTRYWAVTNLVTNPSAEVDAVNWSEGDNAIAPARMSRRRRRLRVRARTRSDSTRSAPATPTSSLRTTARTRRHTV